MTRDTQGKKRTREGEAAVTPPAMPPSGVETEVVEIDDSEDQNVNLSSDIEGILAALQKVRQKAVSDGQKKIEETLNNMAGEIQSLVEETKKKIEKERQNLANTASKAYKEYAKTVDDQAEKYKKAYETFCNAKNSHLQTYEDIFSKYEETTEKILMKCDQQRKKEKAVLTDLQRTCADKISLAEQSVKKKNRDEKSIHEFKKSLGLIFDSDDTSEDVEEWKEY